MKITQIFVSSNCDSVISSAEGTSQWWWKPGKARKFPSLCTRVRRIWIWDIELCWIMECYQTVRYSGERAPCCIFFTHFSDRPGLVQTAWHIILNPAIVLHTLHWKGRTMKNWLLPKVLRNDISTKRWSIRGLPTFPTFIRPIETSGTWI